jgi:hypothetical protein
LGTTPLSIANSVRRNTHMQDSAFTRDAAPRRFLLIARIRRAAYWIFPLAICLAVYWQGLWSWFQQTDFIWLDLRNHVANLPTLVWAMCAPMAQGTFRPFSERGFFLLLSDLFQVRAFPYRLVAFANQFLNVFLVMLVTRKLTRSALAGFVAPLLWLASTTLIIPMAWTAAYNEIQCATFLLLSLYLFIRYTETGERKFYWATWITFLLGFGSQELAVVFPAIAILYSLLFAHKYLRSTLPMLAAAALIAFGMRYAAPNRVSRSYDLSFHPATLGRTLLEHWGTLLGVSEFAEPRHLPVWMVASVSILLTVAVIGFALFQARKNRVPMFCLGWFLIVIAPFLPIHNRTIQYYGAIPSIGLAMLGALALAMAWRRNWFVRSATLALLALYAVPSLIVIHAGMSYYWERSDRARSICQAVAQLKQLNSHKMILLANVDDDLFWSTVYYSKLPVLGWKDVFIAPDSRALIKADPTFDDINGYFLPDSALSKALESRSVLVYRVEGKQLADVTESYNAWFGLDASLAYAFPSPVPERLPISPRKGGYHLGPFRW